MSKVFRGRWKHRDFELHRPGDAGCEIGAAEITAVRTHLRTAKDQYDSHPDQEPSMKTASSVSAVSSVVRGCFRPEQRFD